jgi:diguanylate cyclase
VTSAPAPAAAARHLPSGATAAALSGVTGIPLAVLSGSAAAWYALLASTAAAFVATLAGAYAARRAEGRTRAGWVLLALGSAGWGVGNVYWAGKELAVHAQVLFPSGSDLAFLLFPVCGAAGLWLLAGNAARLGTRLTSLLDGLIFTGSLLAVAWVATLGTIYHRAGDSTWSFVVSLAYPVSDLALGTMVFLLATRTRRGSRRVVGLLILSLLSMTLSDTLFAVGRADGSYTSGQLSDAGWIIGFSALAFAGWFRTHTRIQLEEEVVHGRWQVLLPYVPFGATLAIGVLLLVQGRSLDVVPVVVVLVVFAFVMIRQMVTLLHNSALVEQMEYQAFHDPLTGLATRAVFTDRLEHALALREQGGHDVVAIYLDLNDFTVLNDTLGHEAGDALLKGVAERLRACFRPSDTIARVGGDEFGVLVEGSAKPETEAQRILEGLRRPFALRGGETTPSVSIGVSATRNLPNGTTLTPRSLMKQVDLALAAAKATGTNDYAVFEPIMSHTFDEEMALRRELAQALEAGELTVVHQPIHDLQTRRIVGVEALARWSDGTLGEVPPATFIPVAERAHLIAPIGEFVLDQACLEFVRWNGAGDKYLSVNVSTLQLLEPTFEEMVTTTAARHGLPPRQLVLEVTETALAEESDIAPVLSGLRERGFRVAIDDFGTGYASLRYLQHFPADVIKIDRSYVMDIEHDEEAARLLGALLQMLSTLDLTCIAEGVESEGQATRLAALGCRYTQGFLFSRPTRLHQLDPDAVAPRPVPAARAPSP